ncbi:serine/threonine-protein kinase [Planctomycetaceae bacterium SH139]
MADQSDKHPSSGELDTPLHPSRSPELPTTAGPATKGIGEGIALPHPADQEANQQGKVVDDEAVDDEAEGGEELANAGKLDAAFAAYLKLCDATNLGEEFAEDSSPEDQPAISSDQRRSEFLAQFPELAPELGNLIATADLLQRFVVAESEPAKPRVSPDAETIGAGYTGHLQQPQATGPLDVGAPNIGEMNIDAHNADPSTALTLPLPKVSRGGEQAAGPAAHNATLPGDAVGKKQAGPPLPFELGDYRLERMLGRGGMGVVYLATQRNLDRQVAVKMISSGVFAGEEEVRRFRTEARAAARLKHPNIVTVHDFGYLHGHHYFSMDYVPGTDLAHLLSDGPLPCMLAARYVRDCAHAIHHAHQAGILHRDLKPANVLIDEHDQVQITDFGLAKHTDADSSVTGSGAAVGTPNYMAPEQAMGHGDRANRTADVYSLGAVLFALVTGRSPFAGATVMETLMQVIHRAPPSPREFRDDVPADLETILLKCLEKDPKRRYHSAKALAEDLERYLQGRPVLAKPRGPVQRLWNWVNDVPIVAALSGRRFVDASQTHRRFQTSMLALVILLPLLLTAVVIVDNWNRGRMPDYVRIAGGIPGGVYDEISGELALRISRSQGVDATVISSEGSLDNRQQLLAGDLELAPLQASTIRGDNLCVVAPLFYEMVHVFVRGSEKIHSIDELRGRAVAVGPEGSGSRLAATLLFDSYGMGESDLNLIVSSWGDFDELDQVDGAIVCIGTGSQVVTSLLQLGQFELLPIAESRRVSSDHPTLRPMHIPASEYPPGLLPDDGIDTVGMPAFLAARLDTPNVLVSAALAAIYADPVLDTRLIPRRAAAEFQNMVLHPEARKFFAQ